MNKIGIIYYVSALYHFHECLKHKSEIIPLKKKEAYLTILYCYVCQIPIQLNCQME